MTRPLRFLIAESELPEQRDRRRASVGRSSGETYADALRAIVPDARCDRIHPAEGEAPADGLAGYDAVFLAGSPLHVYHDTPPVRRMVAFMRAVFESGTPAFGSCAGLQVAAAATGGMVRGNAGSQEAGFARRIVPTDAGLAHPLLRGRPTVFDAPAIHDDEVDCLPPGATLLAGNSVTAVQAAEIRHGGGVFWGVQYHPELPLDEIAGALRRQADDLVEQGWAADRAAVERYAAMVDALHAEPESHDLARHLGLDREVTDPSRRQRELRNFIADLVRPVRAGRGRG